MQVIKLPDLSGPQQHWGSADALQGELCVSMEWGGVRGWGAPASQPIFWHRQLRSLLHRCQAAALPLLLPQAPPALFVSPAGPVPVASPSAGGNRVAQQQVGGSDCKCG